MGDTEFTRHRVTRTQTPFITSYHLPLISYQIITVAGLIRVTWRYTWSLGRKTLTTVASTPPFAIATLRRPTRPLDAKGSRILSFARVA